jgi:hypothetical protein
LVQYDERYRVMANRPAAEWLPIDSLMPESRWTLTHMDLSALLYVPS